MTTTNTTTSNTTTMECMICLEDRAIGGSVIPMDADSQTCAHFSCDECFQKYFIECEQQRKPTPICPHPGCQAIINPTTIEKILGRSYKPMVWNLSKEAEGQNDDNHDSNDDSDTVLFQKWLKENEAQQCSNCKVYIVREEGCDAIQCLCGYRFCWTCKGAECNCGHCESEYFDNIWRDEDLEEIPVVATPEDLMNFKEFYLKRRVEGGYDEDEKEEQVEYQNEGIVHEQQEEEKKEEVEKDITLTTNETK